MLPGSSLRLPPDCYKTKPHRARAVTEPRGVLAEFGTILLDVDVRVHNSTAMVRHLVLPRQPEATRKVYRRGAAGRAARHTMIGVLPLTVSKEAGK